MSKKLFNKLIQRASKPVSKAADKQLHLDVNSGKQTRPRKSANAAPKPSGKSPKRNA